MRKLLTISLILATMSCDSGSEFKGSAQRGQLKAQKEGSANPADTASGNPGAELPPMPGNENAEAPMANAPSSGPAPVQAPSPIAAPTTPKPAPSTLPPEAPIQEDEQIAEALPPVPVSGAFLYCEEDLASGAGANCSVKNYDNQVVGLAATKAYYFNTDLVWKETKLAGSEADFFFVEVPKEIQKSSYGIALSTADRRYVADWVLKPTGPQPPTLVLGGSFEDYPFNAGNFIQQDNDNIGWSAILPAMNARCSQAFLEIIADTVNFRAAQGSKYMDLNSTCNDVAGRLSNNSLVRHLMNVTAGHLYQLRFSFARNPQAQGATSANVFLANTWSRNVTVANAVWMERRWTVVPGASGQTYFGFQDTTNNDSGFGTLLDNVQIYDMGTGPR